MSKIVSEIKAKAKELFEQGHTTFQIMEELDINYDNVIYYLKSQGLKARKNYANRKSIFRAEKSKECYDCHKVLELSQYYSNILCADKLSNRCKICDSGRKKIYRESSIGKTKKRNTARVWAARKRKNDLDFRLKLNLRSRVRTAIKKDSKFGKTFELIGCSVEELKMHIESQWEEGMSWENWGVYKDNGYTTWQIDHIIPCASFDFKKEDEQRKCFHYTNSQPLWAAENNKKWNIIQ